MKINLPVFKDEDTKDAITYQSWCWDLTMYHQASWVSRLHSPPLCHLHSLQGYPGEIMRSSGMDITLDDILNILDEHYNNIKALDAPHHRTLSDVCGQEGNHVRLGSVLIKTPADSHGSVIPQNAFLQTG